MGQLRIENKSILFLLGFATSLIACTPSRSKPTDLTTYECVGNLIVKVNLGSAIPNKIKISWRGGGSRITLIDECNIQKDPSTNITKDGNFLVMNQGGFGYTAPQLLDVQIFDQGNCNSESEIFSVEEYKVSESRPQICESVNLEINK